MRPAIDVDEVQGNVLYSYGAAYAHARYLRLRIAGDLAEARDVLRGWMNDVTFGRLPRDASRPHVNIAFTFAGLRALKGNHALLEHFPEEFREGARWRAEQWHETWHRDRSFPPSDVLVSVHARTAAECDHRVAELLGASGRAAGSPLKLVARVQNAGLLDKGEREHFGFADGRSQPAVEGADADPTGDGIYAVAPASGRAARAATALGVVSAPRRWRLIRTGEFLLGYYDEDGELPSGPPAPLGPNGTFMVYRKIEQHVDRFDDYVTAAAARTGLTDTELRAKIMGRWPDGTPIATSAVQDPLIAGDRLRSNDFLYGHDPRGFSCPLGSHVRRANPRDGLPGGAERTMRHRIIRRGMPYGTHGWRERGLVFICFGSSISRGFEYIQEQWIGNGEVLGIADEGPDFLLQGERGEGRMVVQGVRPVALEPPDKPFVTVRGCEYLFVPSREACEWLARP